MKQKWLSLFPVLALIVMMVAPQTASAISEDDVKAILNTMNGQLAQAGEDFRIQKAELLTFDEEGITVLATDFEPHLDSHWVPNDERRYGVPEIYWLIDQVDQTADVAWPSAYAAIDGAMNTWDTTPCANIPLVQVPDYDIDWGYVQYLLGMGGISGWLADLTHGGWLPREFFDAIGGAGGGDSILGVTFTFIWIDTETEEPTDINGDGKDDVAFREIYYNDEFSWGINPPSLSVIDIETVALHETGHGLSLGHYGIILLLPNGELLIIPRAVMNAIYYGVLQNLRWADKLAFCSLWAFWPYF
jgi:hypothetical protein